MKPRVAMITLGVDDLDRSVMFHAEGLGLGMEGIVGREFEARATIVKPARDTFRAGCAGCFQDPDHHLWEAAWNPGFAVASQETPE